MNVEYPTIKIALPLEETQKELLQIAQEIGAKVDLKETQCTLQHEYSLKLDENAADFKLNQIASERFNSKEYFFFFLGLFFFTIVGELTLIKGFYQKETDSTVAYFKMETTPNSSIPQLARNLDTDPEKSKSRGLQPWAAALLVGCSAASFAVAFRGKLVHKRRMNAIKKKLSQEYKAEKQDYRLQEVQETVEIRFFRESGTSEIAFNVEQGSPLILYLAATLMERCQQQSTMNVESLIIANTPMANIYQEFKNRQASSLPMNNQVWRNIQFFPEVGEMKYHSATSVWS